MVALVMEQNMNTFSPLFIFIMRSGVVDTIRGGLLH